MLNLPLEHKALIQQSYVRYTELVLLAQHKRKLRDAAAAVFWLSFCVAVVSLLGVQLPRSIFPFPALVAGVAYYQLRLFKRELAANWDAECVITRAFREMGLYITEESPSYGEWSPQPRSRFVRVTGLDKESTDPLSDRSYVAQP